MEAALATRNEMLGYWCRFGLRPAFIFDLSHNNRPFEETIWRDLKFIWGLWTARCSCLCFSLFLDVPWYLSQLVPRVNSWQRTCQPFHDASSLCCTGRHIQVLQAVSLALRGRWSTKYLYTWSMAPVLQRAMESALVFHEVRPSYHYNEYACGGNDRMLCSPVS